MPTSSSATPSSLPIEDEESFGSTHNAFIIYETCLSMVGSKNSDNDSAT